jgi:hypothetical protein
MAPVDQTHLEAAQDPVDHTHPEAARAPVDQTHLGATKGSVDQTHPVVDQTKPIKWYHRLL